MNKQPMNLGIETRSAKIELQFSYQRDRWQHELVLPLGEQSVVLMSSIEGDEVDDWPPSPPLQEVNQHETPTGLAILGVGMAGRNHWSGSFSIATPDDSHRELVVDLAGNIRHDPGGVEHRLGSAYEINPAGQMADQGELVFDLGGVQIEMSALHGSLFVRHPNRLVVRPGEVSSSGNQAVRWGFVARIR